MEFLIWFYFGDSTQVLMCEVLIFGDVWSSDIYIPLIALQNETTAEKWNFELNMNFFYWRKDAVVTLE